MDQGSRRVIVGVALLALLWIGVYWAWPVGEDGPGPRVTFDATSEPPGDPGPARSDAPTPAPPAIPAPVAAPGRVAPSPAVVPPTFREHTVRRGETLETIAAQELGSADLWRAIAQANPLKDPRRLRSGDVLRIPIDPSNTQGRVPDDDTPPPRAGPVEYVVRRGDTLSSIAKAYYGDAGFSELIAFHNKARLPDPDALRLGQTLELPPLPGQTVP